jgi:Protein of unknown function (DUF664)
MPHPLVDQLRFARSEFRRCLEGVSNEDVVKRLLPMNSLGRIICHLAGQERRFRLNWTQGIMDVVLPDCRPWARGSGSRLTDASSERSRITGTVEPLMLRFTADEAVVA